MAYKESLLTKVNSAVNTMTRGEIWDIRAPIKVIAQAFMGIFLAAGLTGITAWTLTPEHIRTQLWDHFNR